MIKRLLAAAMPLAVCTLGASAIVFECGDFDPSTKTCALTGWSGDLPDNHVLNLPATYMHIGQEYTITAINAGALNNLGAVTDVYIGPKIIRIGAAELNYWGDCGNFFNCPRLERFHVYADNPVFYHSEEGVLMIKPKSWIKVPQRVATDADGRFDMDCLNEVNVLAPNAMAENSTIKTLGVSGFTLYRDNGGLNKAIALEKYEEIKEGTRSTVYNGMLYSKDLTTIYSNPPKNSSSVVAPHYKVTTIAPWAFANCKVTSINWSGVKTLEHHAFYGCTIGSLTLPQNGLTMEEYVFAGCRNLEKIETWCPLTLPPHFASDCPSLTTLRCYGGAHTYGTAAFKNCPQLTNIPFTLSSKYTGDSIFANTGVAEVAFNGSLVPDGGLTIGNGMFADCANLKSVTFPSFITIPGDGKNSSASPVFGDNAPLRTLKMGAFTAGDNALLARYTEGARNIMIYLNGTDAPARSWPLKQFATVADNAVGKAFIFMDVYNPINDDAADPYEFVCPNAMYYVPANTVIHYKKAREANANIQTMFYMEEGIKDGKFKLYLTSALGDRVKLTGVRVNDVDYGDPGLSGEIVANIPPEEVTGIDVYYTIDDVAMHTHYPASRTDALQSINAPSAATDVNVYDIHGRAVATGVNAIDTLPAGLYITSDGRKIRK